LGRQPFQIVTDCLGHLNLNRGPVGPENLKVSKRLLLIVAILSAQAATGAVALGATVYVELFPLTGEIRLTNRDATPFPFIEYQIKSTSGALNPLPSVWKSISDNYDVSGNGFIDPVNNWVKISSSSTELTEGVVPNPGGSLAPFRSISLGDIWNPHTVPNPATDLSFNFTSASNPQPTFQVDYALDGDYNSDNVVSLDDYQNWWKPAFGSTTDLSADGNLDGVIDAADYVIWRKNLGTVLPFPPFGSGSGGGPGLAAAAIPEPTGGMLSLLAAGSAFGWWILPRLSRR
jgi:hypothetical protein